MAGLLWSVSVNETPPRDPAVVGDPYVPYWYRPRYAVRLDEVTAAVREFCRDGGARPTSVGWAEDGGDQGSLYLTTDEYRELVDSGADLRSHVHISGADEPVSILVDDDGQTHQLLTISLLTP